MKRMWLSVGLIAAVVLISAGALLMLTNIKNDFDSRFDSLYLLVERGDNAAAASAA